MIQILPHVFFDPNTCGVMEHFFKKFGRNPTAVTNITTVSRLLLYWEARRTEIAQAIDAQHLSISYPIANRMIFSERI